mgnify:FL=1|jgi:hypothetical protein
MSGKELTKLFHIRTLEDIDGCLFNQRVDTGQLMYLRDIEIIQQIDSSKPVKESYYLDGYFYLPEEAIPEGTNAVFHTKNKVDEVTKLRAEYFCKIDDLPDNGFRRIAKGEIVLPRPPIRSGEAQIGNTNIRWSIG